MEKGNKKLMIQVFYEAGGTGLCFFVHSKEIEWMYK